jgi:hypothetical protein
VTDNINRVVALMPKKRELRFPNMAAAEEEALRKTVDELHPPVKALTISLDRVLAYLDPAQQPQQQAVELNLEPPKIFYSSKPAILVMFLGEPQLQPVEKDKNDLMFAVNTNWDLLGAGVPIPAAVGSQPRSRKPDRNLMARLRRVPVAIR